MLNKYFFTYKQGEEINVGSHDFHFEERDDLAS